jgi:hypothetical protein
LVEQAKCGVLIISQLRPICIVLSLLFVAALDAEIDLVDGNPDRVLSSSGESDTRRAAPLGTARPGGRVRLKAIVRLVIGADQDYEMPAPIATRSPDARVLSLVLWLASRTTFSAPVLAASAKVS